MIHTHLTVDFNPIGLPRRHSGKESACNAGDADLIPGWGRSLGEGNGNPLQYSCLENPIDRGAWRATVHGVAKSRTQLSTHSVVVLFNLIAITVREGNSENKISVVSL